MFFGVSFFFFRLLISYLVVCVILFNCVGYGQYFSGVCYYIIIDGCCDGVQSWSDKFYYYNIEGLGYVIGNGQCGFLNL